MILTPALKAFLTKPPSPTVAWQPPINSEVGSILAAQGQKFDREIYLSLLADRVEDWIKEADDPEGMEKYFRQRLDEAGLTDSHLSLREIITDNPEIYSRLSQMRVFPKVGEVANVDNPEARRHLKEIKMDEWVDRVTADSNR